MATENKGRGESRWKRRGKETAVQTEVEPVQKKQPTPEPPIKKGIYLSALVYIEGEQAAPDDFTATATDALKKRLSTTSAEAGNLRITVKKIEVQNDIEEEGDEAKEGEEKFQF